MPRVLMWGLSLYCCVSHRCCKAEQRLLHNHNLRRPVLRAFVMGGGVGGRGGRGRDGCGGGGGGG